MEKIFSWSLCTNLKPLVNFLSEIHPEGLNLNLISHEVNRSHQSLTRMFSWDNARLSTVESIVRAYGYELRLVYKYRGVYPFRGEIYWPDGVGNLYGLAEYALRMNRTIYHVASVAGISKNTLRSALEKGDMKVATLLKACSNLDIEVIWIFKSHNHEL